MSRPHVHAVVIGAGLMGHWHAHAARRAGAAVVDIVDRDPARADALARRLGGARACASLGAALASGPAAAAVTVVHICTPLESHLSLATEALDGGGHVLVEKPLVADSESAEALYAIAAAHGRLVCPVHQFLFQPGAQRAAALRPALGTLRHLEMEVASTGADVSGHDRDDVALEILPHGLAFAARWCGPRIAACDWDLLRASPGELAVSTVVGATRVSIRISLHGRPPMNRLRLVGDGGTIELDLFNGFAVVDRSAATRLMKIARPLRSALALGVAASRNLVVRAAHAETAYPGLRELVRRFYAAIVGAGAPPIPVDESLAVTDVWSRLRRTLRTEPAALLSPVLTHPR